MGRRRRRTRTRRRRGTGGREGGEHVRREELNAMIACSLFFRRKIVMAFMNSHNLGIYIL